MTAHAHPDLFDTRVSQGGGKPARAPVKVLYPLLHLSICLCILMLVLSPSSWLADLYVCQLLFWHFLVMLALYRDGWRKQAEVCSHEASLSIIASLWYALIGWTLDVPSASLLMVITFSTLLLYGWVCRVRP